MHAFAQSRAMPLEDNRVKVQLDVDAADIPQIRAVVSSVGGDVTGTVADAGLGQAWVPVPALETIPARPEVQVVQRPPEIQLFEPHSQVDGTTRHGTACAEIIHDLAPGAELYLVKIATLVDLSQAVDYLRSQNVDITSTSLGFYNVSPGDGTGPLADIVEQARSDGIFWTTAAGNDRQAHWSGQFIDNDDNRWHEFDSGQEVNFYGPGSNTYYNIPSGYLVAGYLRWDDWDNVEAYT